MGPLERVCVMLTKIAYWKSGAERGRSMNAMNLAAAQITSFILALVDGACMLATSTVVG